MQTATASLEPVATSVDTVTISFDTAPTSLDTDVASLDTAAASSSIQTDAVQPAAEPVTGQATEADVIMALRAELRGLQNENLVLRREIQQLRFPTDHMTLWRTQTVREYAVYLTKPDRFSSGTVNDTS